jgi:carboxyl-terminal processing protease
MEEIRNTKGQVRLPIIIAAAVSVGLVVGTLIVNPKAPVATESSKAVAKFREVITNIDQSYVDSVNSSELVDMAIVNMLEELDPHTAYISAEQLALSNMHLRGGYDGIGVQFDILQDSIVVVKPSPNGPAERVGVKMGDRIIQVEDEMLTGIDINNRDVTDRLLGKEGTTVNITIWRPADKKTYEFEITRGQIPQNTVIASYMATDDIGYIKLVSFGINSYDEFKTALSNLKEQGMTKLILDLQGNGGGYMAAAEKIADEMIGGNSVIVSQKGKVERYSSTVNAQREGIFEDEPVIVLMDEYSASASEIVAGALQDNDRALIVGRRSYGKGLVQMPINLVDGSELRLTIARYYTPTGRSIQKPYVNGGDIDYAHDIIDRFSHGEFYIEDSIKLNDSLKFTTPKGRIVYGGGGIMPDNFVPYDSALNTNYYNELIDKRVLREFTLNFILNNKTDLENRTFEQYLTEYKVSDDQIQQLQRLAARRGVLLDNSDLTVSSAHIKSHIKAEIARGIWDEEEFFRIYNQTSNKAFERALTLFDDAQALVLDAQ